MDPEDPSNTENAPLLEASAAPLRRRKIGAGALVLALCVGAAAATQSPFPRAAASLLGVGHSEPIEYPQFLSDLNYQMRQTSNFHDDNKNNVYQDGDNVGVIFRSINDGQNAWWVEQDGTTDYPTEAPISERCLHSDGVTKINCVAAATFWHNDIVAISQFYETDPFCPNVDDWHDCNDPSNYYAHPWENAGVGVVVGSSMETLLADSGMIEFDNIQEYGHDGAWGYGVFYAHDSNGGDFRCAFINMGDDGCFYDCPTGWIESDCDGNRGDWHDDDSKKGAGAYPPGNPFSDTGGGGAAGCHWDTDHINQLGMWDTGDGMPTLTGDATCQCNYQYNGLGDYGWDDWVDHMKVYSDNLLGKDYYPSWLGDSAACWLNNFKDVIKLQNALYWGRDAYLSNNIPVSSFDFVQEGDKARHFWGWNEIAVRAGDYDTPGINNPAYWDVIAIALPAFACGTDKKGYKQDQLKCLTDTAKQHLDDTLDNYILNGALKTGQENAASRPGSAVAFVRQNPDYLRKKKDWDSTLGWTREFYCQNAATNKYKIVYDKDTDACYLDYV